MDHLIANVVIIVFSLILTFGAIVAMVFFLVSLQRAFRLCTAANRTLEPGRVWLCLIPLFNLVWIFVVVSRLSESLRREFESRHAPQQDYGRSIGLAYCILAVFSSIPFIGLLTSPALIVCWIIYWLRISRHSRLLEQKEPTPAAQPLRESREAEEPLLTAKSWLALAILMFAFGGQFLQSAALSWYAPGLEKQFNLTPQGLGRILLAFAIGLIAGYILMTPVTALLGTRWGLTLALGGMTLAALASGRVAGAWELGGVHAIEGFFAGGLLPAAIQSLREFFPARIRPLAIGLFLATTSLAGLLAWLAGPHILGEVSWRTMSTLSAVPTLAAAVLCWFLWQRPAPRAPSRGNLVVGVVSVVMLALGILLAAPLYVYAQTFLPFFAQSALGKGITQLGIIDPAALAGGAVLAGAIAWALVNSGASAWKTRAMLLTIFGVILPLVAMLGVFSKGHVAVLFVSAAVLAAFGGWSTMLYVAVADTLPVRGVCIGAAMGGLILAVILAVAYPVFGNFMQQGGTWILAMVGGLAAAGTLCTVSLAWVVRPE